MIQPIATFITYSLFHLSGTTASMVEFFIYDSIKILLLLYVMIGVIGFGRSYIDNAKLKKWMSGQNKLLSHTVAALFGAVTPFCSCSSIPIFLGMVKAQFPIGAAFSFMVTSPLINEYLVVLMFGFFGWKITVFYVLSGLILGIASGLIIGQMNPEKLIEKKYKEASELNEGQKFKTLKQRIKFGLSEAWETVVYIWLWVIGAVAVGALIHNYVPDKLIKSMVGSMGAFSVPIATLLGVPMYGSCAAIVPIAMVLFEKGLPLGTAIAFMMGVAALSLPEAIILKRVMKTRLIVIFFSVVSIGIMLSGYLLNWLQPLLVIH
jgi:uncharacterized membrane protein YraQ (UPF0718 family)